MRQFIIRIPKAHRIPGKQDSMCKDLSNNECTISATPGRRKLTSQTECARMTVSVGG